MKGTAYLIQATLISLWWIGLFLNQDFYAAFQFPEISPTAFNAFMLPDLIVIALLSVVRAYNERREIEFVVFGAFGFASLYCLNATILTGGGFLPTTLMILGLCYNGFLISGNKVFRASQTSNNAINLLKTLVQIVCVWVITLALFPMIILGAFDCAIPSPAEWNVFGIVLFVLSSFLGLYSAYTMVKIGKGTPLPLDQTQELVTRGPYKFVRNPMAVAGIGQGVAVGLMLGSIHVVIYAIFGALMWQWVVRPLEEKDMEERFGESYQAYKRKVKCWIPTFKF